ncbi:MAG: hypothetical protein AAGG51_25990 [Cyanobacteria bacterium P01_G01_bin.54]
MSQSLIFREENLFFANANRRLFKRFSIDEVFDIFQRLLGKINLELDEEERDFLLGTVDLKFLDQEISFNEQSIKPELEKSDYMIPNSSIYLVSPGLWQSLEQVIQARLAAATDTVQKEEITEDFYTLKRLYEQKRLFVDVF